MISELTLTLFGWWAISISWSIVFLIVAGFYVFSTSRTRNKKNKFNQTEQKTDNGSSVVERGMKIRFRTRVERLVKNFIFVWVLLSLLVFYIFSVQLGTGAFSEAVFALGNVVVEVLLIFYLVRNRDKVKTEIREEPKTS